VASGAPASASEVTPVYAHAHSVMTASDNVSQHSSLTEAHPSSKSTCEHNSSTTSRIPGLAKLTVAFPLLRRRRHEAAPSPLVQNLSVTKLQHGTVLGHSALQQHQINAREHLSGVSSGSVVPLVEVAAAPAPHVSPQVGRGLSADSLVIDWTRPIGKGGMGSVHLGSWLGTRVAVKVMNSKQGQGVTGSCWGHYLHQRIREEAVALSRLRHPCICSFFATIDLIGGGKAIVMEYLPGGTLCMLLHGKWQRGVEGVALASSMHAHPTQMSQTAPIALSTALISRIARETASGIAFLHANQYMHRDIKSANILLDSKCNAKVADFGLAKLHLSELSTEDAVDLPNDAEHTVDCGTLKYMAPEIRQTADNPHPAYGLRCDVYSFGILLWEMLHRQPPFKNLSSSMANAAVLRGERPPMDLSDKRADFAPIIESCWRQEAAQRPHMRVVVQRLMQLEAEANCQGSSDTYSFVASSLAAMPQAPSPADAPSLPDKFQSLESIDVEAIESLSTRAGPANTEDVSLSLSPSHVLAPHSTYSSGPRRWHVFTQFLNRSRAMWMWQKAIRIVLAWLSFVRITRELIEVRRARSLR